MVKLYTCPKCNQYLPEKHDCEGTVRYIWNQNLEIIQNYLKEIEDFNKRHKRKDKRMR